MKILFVGLSNKIGKEPFDETTNTGKVVHQIASMTNDECYFKNLVSYAPVDKNNKLRYPKKNEIDDSLPTFFNYLADIKPDVVISFGTIVSTVLSKIDAIDDILISAKHPSYIYTYKRKELDDYISNLLIKINNLRK